MRLVPLAGRLRAYYQQYGPLATVRFLATRIARHQRHVVFEAVLKSEPEEIPWLDGERLTVIDSHSLKSEIGADLRAFLGGDNARENIEGVRNGDELFVISNGSAYHHCGYILFRTRQTRILGEPSGTPLIACCFTSPAARGRGLYRRALIAELHHLWNRGYRRVVIETSPDNLPSRKGIEAAGFQFCREVSAWILLNCLVMQTRSESAGAVRRLMLI